MLLVGCGTAAWAWRYQRRFVGLLHAGDWNRGNLVRIAAIVRYRDSAVIGLRSITGLETFAVALPGRDAATVSVLEQWWLRGSLVGVALDCSERLELRHADTRRVVALVPARS